MACAVVSRPAIRKFNTKSSSKSSLWHSPDFMNKPTKLSPMDESALAFKSLTIFLL